MIHLNKNGVNQNGYKISNMKNDFFYNFSFLDMFYHIYLIINKRNMDPEKKLVTHTALAIVA